MELCRVGLSWASPMAPVFQLPPKSPVHEQRSLRIVCVSGNGESTDENSSKMVISVTGATGFRGKRLVQKLVADNHSVQVLTRSRSKAQAVFPEKPEWKKYIQGSDAVVNLAGLPISTRWSPEIKKEIKQSRINVTSKVVDNINQSSDNTRPLR